MKDPVDVVEQVPPLKHGELAQAFIIIALNYFIIMGKQYFKDFIYSLQVWQLDPVNPDGHIHVNCPELLD